MSQRSLLDLPAEVRLEIYKHLLPTNGYNNPNDSTGLRQSCKKLRDEYHAELNKAMTNYAESLATSINSAHGSVPPVHVAIPTIDGIPDSKSLSICLPILHRRSTAQLPVYQTLNQVLQSLNCQIASVSISFYDGDDTVIKNDRRLAAELVMDALEIYFENQIHVSRHHTANALGGLMEVNLRWAHRMSWKGLEGLGVLSVVVCSSSVWKLARRDVNRTSWRLQRYSDKSECHPCSRRYGIE